MVDSRARFSRDDGRDVGNPGAFHMEAPRRTATMDEAQHYMLVASAAPLRFALHLAVESLVNFDNLARAAHRLHANGAHGLADAVRHEPRGFEAHAKAAM